MLNRIAACALALILLAFGARAEEEPPLPFADDEGAPFAYIEEAMEVYSWFVMRPLDVDRSLPSADGTRARVLDERFDTRAELEAILGEYFAAPIVAELFAWNAYLEGDDGYIYALSDWRPVDERITDVECQPVELTKARVEYVVTVYYLDEDGAATPSENFYYALEPLDGKWIFTEFSFYW